MSNLAFFIPHDGCPQQCSFCNQYTISGQQSVPSFSFVKREIEKSASFLKDKTANTEIAFFGGSFTGLGESTIKGYLDVAKESVNRFGFSGIRFSTRPDYIYPKIIALLSDYPVTHIELGAQSMDNAVLQGNTRGHTAEDTKNAARLILKSGYGLTLQMMTGLYKDTPEGSVRTAKALSELQPDSVRIYPTLVLKGTQLEQLYNSGDYLPMSLKESVILCSELFDLFTQKGIEVIRLGLHDQPGLEQEKIAGPYHPAFGELCRGYSLFSQIEGDLHSGENIVSVNPRDISALAGHGRWVLNNFAPKYDIKIKTSADIPRGKAIVVNYDTAKGH